ncbi:MAG: prephenate dehydrogenase [Treponema sp.]|nr:prephenate dehydrogenase [Treponema sp.]
MLCNLNYGIVGLGIMGGSFARAIQENILEVKEATGKIFACDRNEYSLKEALKYSVIDEGFAPENVDEMLSKCDVVIICLYPALIVDFMKEHKTAFKKGAIVTDISGVKAIYKNHFDEFETGDYDFIIGHPMAGGEKEGFVAAKGEYFKNHNYLLLPRSCNKPENLNLIRELIYSIGFSKITDTDIDTHDYNIGFTSQLCHVVASAMVLSAPNDEITAFGGGSFEDLTRIAMINAPLWTELFLENKDKLLPHIKSLGDQLKLFEEMIEKEERSKMEDVLRNVRLHRQAMQAK